MVQNKSTIADEWERGDTISATVARKANISLHPKVLRQESQSDRCMKSSTQITCCPTLVIPDSELKEDDLSATEHLRTWRNKFADFI